RLSAAATYLYPEGGRYWYSTQPTVTKLAEDRAEQFKRAPDKVAQEIDKRLRADLRKIGDFSRIHPLPQSGQDVPDDMDARLVVLGIDHPYGKGGGSAAEAAAKAIFESRGSAPRLFRNTLVFLAVDQTRLQDLDEAARRFLAWESIVTEKDKLDLSPHQVRQAEAQKDAADGAVTARLPEAYQWLLVPVQTSPQASVEWQAFRLTGQDALAVRASKKLKNDELLVTALAGTRLRMELDRVPLWRGDHVAIKQLAEDFARYVYLPRLKDTAVLLAAVRDGLGLLLWQQESFGYADSFDKAATRYRGLRVGQHRVIANSEAAGLLVRPEVAQRQLEMEAAGKAAAGEGAAGEPPGGGQGGRPGGTGQAPSGPGSGPTVAPKPKRFHGSVALDPTRVGRDASRVGDEVIAHLAGLLGATMKVTLEIEADIPGGVPDTVVRTVTENSKTLKFSNQGFETE
ncbi:MAG: AAA+ family ATPase, partial [Candidatus Rokubacteria bacterium]|nr:AAA+ family ATPase [Candidatus Rokubacteria bacterium]